MMLRRSILIEPELSEPKAYTKEKKFSFSGEQKEKPFRVLIFLLPLLDAFRTLNWNKIQQDLEFSGILSLYPNLSLQNL